MLPADKTKAKSSKPKRSREKPISSSTIEVADYRHKGETRKNVPDAGLAIYNYKPQEPVKYNYDPHLDPQLIWTGKAEHPSFEVETVSLHIHERVSTEAILKSVQRAGHFQQLKLFAEPDLPLDKRIEFYKHEMDWTNRLILGDSLLVMNSLKERELMEGKVQTIYVDPPYGIKYASNFQSQINRRDVKDTDEDLTREPEQIQAYRDTWELGVHSYLTYLRDRLLPCRDLLHQTGSIFVQISDDNLHRVRCLMDEIFGSENFCALIAFQKTGGLTRALIETITDYLLWYAKDKSQVKYHQLYQAKTLGDLSSDITPWMLESPDGLESRRMSKDELSNPTFRPSGWRIFRPGPLTSQGHSPGTSVPYVFQGETFSPGPNRHWTTAPERLDRLAAAERIFKYGKTIQHRLYPDDFPVIPLKNVWQDTQLGGFSDPRIYVVQTNTKVIERCILMTTDPGDIVLDPTCGSGTTAYCAEKWGRRWVTCDTSRVAIAIARQRMLSAKYDYFQLADPERGPSGDFLYETVPHIMLETIAYDSEIDDIVREFASQVNATLSELNSALNKKWKQWEVPLRADQAWSAKAQDAHSRFWQLKLERRKRIEQSIHTKARPEILYDRPKPRHDLVRVSGPFTVEAIPAPAVQERTSASIGPARTVIVGDYVKLTLDLLQKSGIIFLGGKRMSLENLRPTTSAGFIHAEGEAIQNGGKIRVAISLGPRYGPVTAKQVDEAIRSSYRMQFDVLIFAGFAFDAEAQAVIQKNPIPKVSVQMAHINPDIIVGAYSNRPLLKTMKTSQIFTVFGEPDVKLDKSNEEFRVRLLGVDLYDPTTGDIHSSNASGIPAWFLDEDYDGYTFKICQAFFPSEATAKNPWDRLENALKGIVDKERMDAFRGTESLPFKAGEQKQIAVKVIDVRGNEVMVVRSLNGKETP
jgi:adenine-specific DNA-methyltransferase